MTEIELSNDGVSKQTVTIDNGFCMFTDWDKQDNVWKEWSSYAVDIEHIKRIAKEIKNI